MFPEPEQDSAVEVKLNTHDAGGLTELDFELARRMSFYAG
jgi:4a-hydroxytetrahydrobiopterin dehydratase